MASDPKKLVADIKKGKAHAIARAISLIEDRNQAAEEIVQLLFPDTGRAHVIGITGPPGAGKSTLVDRLATFIIGLGCRVAILAIDPTSPFTGGALLGDRIRMNNAAAIPGSFIRSMASRGALGGIAPTTSEAIYVLEAAGFDYVIVETVGVGQGEVEIVRTCDTCVVVLVPGMGDEIQALKAGILEIADVFAINKADRDGVDRLQKELTGLLSLTPEGTRKPAILQTVATEGKGTAALYEELKKYHAAVTETGELQKRKKLFLRESLYRQISQELVSGVVRFAERKGLLEPALEELLARKSDPFTVARELITASLGKGQRSQ